MKTIAVAFVRIDKHWHILLYECPYARMVWQYVSFKNNKCITLYDVICGTDNVVYDTLIGYLCKYIYRVNLLNKTEYFDNSKIKQGFTRELCFIQKKSIVITLQISK